MEIFQVFRLLLNTVKILSHRYIVYLLVYFFQKHTYLKCIISYQIFSMTFVLNVLSTLFGAAKRIYVAKEKLMS